MKRRTKIISVILVLFVVVGGASAASGAGRRKSAQEIGQQQTEEAFLAQRTAVPYPADALKDSLERRNLREKLLRLNRPDKIGYVYLMSQNGSVVSFYTIKGKVSSNDSQMSTNDLINCHYRYEQGCEVVNAPGDDGSYGPNEQGIFFFTTENVLVQWNGPYLYTDAPLQVKSAPVLVATAGAQPSSTGG